MLRIPVRKKKKRWEIVMIVEKRIIVIRIVVGKRIRVVMRKKLDRDLAKKIFRNFNHFLQKLV